VTVGPGEILFSIVLFGLIYVLLGGLWLYLLKRKIQTGPLGEMEVA
jgi:cytochrome bd-type quinol oxidase subunit 1